MFEKKLQMTEMMEAEMRKKMMERREGLEFDMFSRFDTNEKNRREKEKNEQRRKKREEQKQ